MLDPAVYGRPPFITASEGVQLLPSGSRYILRGGGAAFAAAAEALGMLMPKGVCRASVHGGWAGLWLGPDERLLLGPKRDDCSTEHVLGSALCDLPHSLVDVSHRQVSLQVGGRHATRLLNTGCPLDLDQQAFPVGMCTRTILAKAQIVLWRTDATAFHLEVWRSFAGYVSEFLAEAQKQIG